MAPLSTLPAEAHSRGLLTSSEIPELRNSSCSTGRTQHVAPNHGGAPSFLPAGKDPGKAAHKVGSKCGAAQLAGALGLPTIGLSVQTGHGASSLELQAAGAPESSVQSAAA